MAKRKYAYIILLGFMLFGFQNCSLSEHVQYGDGSSVNLASVSCQEIQRATFQETYYPVFKNKCSACHAGGDGFGQFAHVDSLRAYDEFQGLGRARVEANFLNAAHRPPSTGPANATIVAQYAADWARADEAAASCQNGPNPNMPGIRSFSKTDARIFTANAGVFTRLEWNMAVDIEDKLKGFYPVTIGIEIRKALLSGNVMGYEFRNPTARLNAGAPSNFQIKGLRIVRNDILQTDVSTFELLNYNVATNTNAIMQGGAFGLLVAPVANTDTFAIQMDQMYEYTPPVVVPPPTPTPPPGPLPLPVTVTFAELQSGDARLGVFKKSCNGCHNSGNMNGGLDLTNYAAAMASASQIKARMNNAGNPMPKSGLLASDSVGIVGVWVDGGAKP